MSEYMNPIKSVSIQLCDEPLLTIHCDGRVTASDKLKPEETARLALDELRKQWLNDAQAVKIRELKVQIERLDKWKQSALEIEREWDANAIATMLGGRLGESHRKVIQREVPKLLIRIKRLEEAIEGTIKWIVDLANSGDAGFWNPEEQSVIIAARAALNKEAKL